MFLLQDEVECQKIYDLVKKIEPNIDYDYIMVDETQFILYRKRNNNKGFSSKTFILERNLLKEEI